MAEMLITSVGLSNNAADSGTAMTSTAIEVAVPSTDAFEVSVGLQLLCLNSVSPAKRDRLGPREEPRFGRFVCCQIAAKNDQIPRCNTERDSGGSAGSNLAGDTRSTRLGCRCTRAHHLPIGGAFVGVRVVP